MDDLPFQPASLLCEARRRSGITQEQLARRAGTSQAAISRLERGIASPSFDTLERLLLVMGQRLELGAAPVELDDVDIDEVRHARSMPIHERLERACAWNAFASRISGVADRETRQQ